MFRTLMTTLLCATGLFAQTVQRSTTIQVGDLAAFGPVGMTTALAGPMSNVTGAPYSAQSNTERVQVLADGNRIVQSNLGSVARDGQGRVRRDESLQGFKTDTGEAPRIIMIDDPVAQVHWTLDARTKSAMKMPLPNTKGGAPLVLAGSAFASSATFSSSSITAVAAGSTPANDSKVAKADLGTQTIEGVPAQGTRMTRTIPAGEFGNEQPIVITTETWYSPDLKVLVMSKSSDPRMGDTTYTLTNIRRSEPDPSLFAVPDDYTIKDAPVIQMQKPQ